MKRVAETHISLAHAAFGTSKSPAERKNFDGLIQDEIIEAKRLQKQLGVTWSEALRLSGKVEVRA